MNNAEAEEKIKALQKFENAKAFQANRSISEVSKAFASSLDTFLETLDEKLAPILSRIDAIEARPIPGGDSIREELSELAHGVALDLNEVEGRIDTRLKGLEKSVEEIKTKGLEYCGVHQRALSYRKGSIVTSGGSAWIALIHSPNGAPGDSPDWQLMVKGAR
jgi:hypothetical protein